MVATFLRFGWFWDNLSCRAAVLLLQEQGGSSYRCLLYWFMQVTCWLSPSAA